MEQFGDGEPLLQVTSSLPSVVKPENTSNVSSTWPVASAVETPSSVLSQAVSVVGSALHWKNVMSPFAVNPLPVMVTFCPSLSPEEHWLIVID